MPNPKKTRYNQGQKQQNEVARNLDQLAEYDEFCNRILPQLRKMLADPNKSASDVYSVAQKEMAARMVTIALTEKDPKTAMTAIRDALDRTMGKAKETLEVHNRYEDMSDEALERMIKQEEAASEELPN
jgi:hypothetical protein